MWLKHFTKTNQYKSLNKEQQEAVALPFNENGLVIAGAGSGKTKTLITRINALVYTKVYQPSEIVALTFTNKAAYEMQERLDSEGVLIGTFHSFALSLIKEDLQGFGFKKLHLLDEKQQYLFTKRLFIDQNWDMKNKAIDKLLDFINDQKEQGIRANKCKFIGKGIKDLINKYKIYEEKLRETEHVDFADLLLLLNERLQDETYLNSLKERFKVFLVDEFQDTNPIQYQTLLLLAQSIFAVGDDCQAIYSFRGANVKNIFEFKQLVGENYVKLEQNYRSTKNIVTISNKFIEKAKERIDKSLWTSQEKGADISVMKAFNEKEEANFVADKIDLLANNNYGDFAVLYRGNAQSAKIEAALSLRKIPYKVSGGMSFFEYSEIRTLISCARILVNPNNANDFIRVLTKLKYIKLEKSFLEKWIIEAEAEKMNFLDLLYRKSVRYTEITDLLKIISAGQDLFQFNDLYYAFDEYLHNVGFFEYLKTETNYDVRLERVKFFLEQIQQYEDDGGQSFTDFIYKISNTQNLLLDQNVASVQLQTIHASKGLEYPYVFVIGVEDGVIPSLHSFEDVEEERRLMYVALTRAKKELFLTFCENRFNGYEYVQYPPSRFFWDLDPKLINPINTYWLPDPLPFSLEEREEIVERNEDLLRLEEERLIQERQTLEVGVEVEYSKEIKKETKFDLHKRYKTKFGVGELIKIEFNEYNEEVLIIQLSNRTVKLLSEYDQVVSV